MRTPRYAPIVSASTGGSRIVGDVLHVEAPVGTHRRLGPGGAAGNWTADRRYRHRGGRLEHVTLADAEGGKKRLAQMRRGWSGRGWGRGPPAEETPVDARLALSRCPARPRPVVIDDHDVPGPGTTITRLRPVRSPPGCPRTGRREPAGLEKAIGRTASARAAGRGEHASAASRVLLRPPAAQVPAAMSRSSRSLHVTDDRHTVGPTDRQRTGRRGTGPGRDAGVGAIAATRGRGGTWPLITCTFSN